MLVQVLVVLLILASGLIVQIAQGYYHFEFGLYFRELFLNRLTQFWILCVLAMFVQTIVNNKYLGHFVMVLYLVATIALPAAGFQHYLYRFGQTPHVTYSDMNGYGPYVQPLFWIRLYWGLAAVLLAMVTNLFWVRGTESSWRVRLNLAGARLSRAALAGASACLVLFVGVGGYIFYNTNVLNPYRTTFKVDEGRAQYEKKYRQYWSLPQPRITDVTTQVDIYPDKRSVSVRGHDVAGKQNLGRHRSRCTDYVASRSRPRCRYLTSGSSASALPAGRPPLDRRSIAGLLSVSPAGSVTAAWPNSA